MGDDNTTIYSAADGSVAGMKISQRSTNNVCPSVAEKDWSCDPILAAAMTWTAQPQSIEATEAMDPTVFASTIKPDKYYRL